MMKTNEALIKKLKSNNANIGIIGLGYVGIPLALRFAAVGLKVTGFDIDQQRVDDLNAGKSPISNIASDKIVEMNNSGFVATSDLALISTVDAIIICVPTPLNKFREPDMSFIISTMTSIVPFIREQQLLSLESTTYPGTTRELLLPYIEQAGMTAGVDYFLVYSPEREDPGNQKFETRTIPKIVGGVTPACLEAGKALYAKAVDQVVSVATVEVAEMAKLLENIHRAVNIGLVNEMKIIADKMGINIIDVIDAAATKPFGFTPYYPGPGLGGHCIPIDPFYLTWKAREFGVNTRFIELAGEINQKMPDWVVSKIVGGLNNFNKSVKGSKILALGIAYKKDVDDMRESPAVMVMELLRILGAEVSYHDPYVPKFPKMREHKFDLSSIKLTDENIAEFDCVVVLTDHSNIDYNAVLRSCQFMVDTRNVIVKDDQKILRA